MLELGSIRDIEMVDFWGSISETRPPWQSREKSSMGTKNAIKGHECNQVDYGLILCHAFSFGAVASPKPERQSGFTVGPGWASGAVLDPEPGAVHSL